jgi:DNA-binding response OmpR family regulator
VLRHRAGSGSGDAVKVLVCSMDDVRASILERFLAAEGMAIATVASIDDACEAGQAEAPDVLVIDTDSVGTDAIRLVRSEQRGMQDVAIVVVSSHSSPLYATACGADAVVTLPSHVRGIVESVKSVARLSSDELAAARASTWRRLRAAG